jgi:CheY-like chemotaxis protein
MPKKRILVVDDEPSFTRIVRLNLEKTGDYEVREANDGRSALALAREFLPHLVLLDVVMPDIDGGDVAASLQRDPKLKHIPVVFLTAVVRRREAGSSGLHSGGAVFLAKPVGSESLIRCIEENVLPEPPPS